MESLMGITSYQQYKQAMDMEIHKATEGFVRIGYLLKMARDNNTILESSGYKDVVEFAQAEYHIDKTQVSRFIRINDRFSEGGNSDRLMDRYREFGYAKLAIMLQLPDGLNEILTPEYSKAEIQAVKEEYDEEQKTTELEVMMEGQDMAQIALDTTIAKALHQLFKENPEKYIEIHRSIGRGMAAVMEIMAPAGCAIYNIRIQGVGRRALSIQEGKDMVSIVNVRDGEMENVPWIEVMETLETMINTLQEPEFNWENLYGETFPKNPEVVPVQPTARTTEKSLEKPVQRKESKVVKSKPAEKKPKQEEKKPEAPMSAEEPLPGQMDITEFKEVLPEPAENSINALHGDDLEPEIIAEEDMEVLEEPQTRIPSLAEALSVEEARKEIVRNKAAITTALRKAPRYMVNGEWDELGRIAMDIKFRADKIKELERK